MNAIFVGFSPLSCSRVKACSMKELLPLLVFGISGFTGLVVQEACMGYISWPVTVIGTKVLALIKCQNRIKGPVFKFHGASQEGCSNKHSLNISSGFKPLLGSPQVGSNLTAYFFLKKKHHKAPLGYCKNVYQTKTKEKQKIKKRKILQHLKE